MSQVRPANGRAGPRQKSGARSSQTSRFLFAFVASGQPAEIRGFTRSACGPSARREGHAGRGASDSVGTPVGTPVCTPDYTPVGKIGNELRVRLGRKTSGPSEALHPFGPRATDSADRARYGPLPELQRRDATQRGPL
jgi:hypothetical protein